MLDLFKPENLPLEVTIEGEIFLVQSDFRYGILFSLLGEKAKITVADILVFFPYKKPKNIEKALEGLKNYYYPTSILPRTSDGSSGNILSFNYDSELIYSAFREVYNIDLLDTKLKMHWYTFKALLNGLHDTKLNKILEYRCYESDGKNSEHDKFMKKMRRMWELPQPEVRDEALEKFNALFD